MSLTLTDLFAGAGGSSTGAIATPGVEVHIAANHWDRAVEVHNANHPQALHICADVSQINPRRFPTSDILWASPECTNHSIAKGRRLAGAQPDLFGETLPDAAAERSRATMWDVPRFTEAHHYQAVIVENVVEVRKWAPYAAWLQAMRLLGYEHREVFLNSAYAQARGLPAPQSRDRIYIVFWREGNTAPDLERWTSPQAYCPHCQATVAARQVWKRPERPGGRYRSQYTYNCPQCWNVVEPGWLPAAAAIDWSLLGERIGDRKKPLAEKTRRRIAAGIARYWRPLVVEAAGNTFDAANPRQPQHGQANDTARPTIDPLGTLTTKDRYALVLRFYGTSPRGGSDQSLSTPAIEPLRTLTAARPPALITRHYSSAGDDAYMTTPVTETLRTLTTTAQQSVVTPGDIEAAEAQVDDCLFRMLEPHEVAAGMAFPADYVWSGTRRERVRLAGNAVTPPAARDLIAAIVESLEGAAA